MNGIDVLKMITGQLRLNNKPLTYIDWMLDLPQRKYYTVLIIGNPQYLRYRGRSQLEIIIPSSDTSGQEAKLLDLADPKLIPTIQAIINRRATGEQGYLTYYEIVQKAVIFDDKAIISGELAMGPIIVKETVSLGSITQDKRYTYEEILEIFPEENGSLVNALVKRCQQHEETIAQLQKQLVETKRIEYRVIDTRNTGVPLGEGNNYTEKLTDGLNRLGQDGWQLVARTSDYLMIFARPQQ